MLDLAYVSSSTLFHANVIFLTGCSLGIRGSFRGNYDRESEFFGTYEDPNFAKMLALGGRCWRGVSGFASLLLSNPK